MSRMFTLSPGLKAAAVAALTLLLMVPIALVGDLIDERRHRADEAEASIAQQWGRAQTLAAAYVVAEVPNKPTARDAAFVATSEPHVLLPERIEVDGVVHAERRARGLFEVPVYRAELRVRATFAAADLAALRKRAGAAPALRLAFSDARGLRALDTVSVDGAATRPNAIGPELGGLTALGLALPQHDRDVELAYTMSLAGIGRLSILPLGRTSRVTIKGDWPHPSFSGAYLPGERRVDEAGFEAHWQVLELARELPQTAPLARYCDDGLDASAFGVTLYQPASVYQQADRSTKYGVLMVALIFIAMFLFEILTGTPLHPLQYLLVGLTLATFYLLLLALSEHAGFAPAYLVAAAIAVAMVGGYAAAILGSRRRALALAGLQSAAYGVFFALVRSEDHALLMGALVLAAALATVMWLTRRTDWYALGARE